MGLKNIVGIISSLRREVTDFGSMSESIMKAVNNLISTLQDYSVKNPIGEYRAFWYLENLQDCGEVRLRYGISNNGLLSRGMSNGSNLEWAVYNLVRVLDQYVRINDTKWEYFVLPNGTTFFRGLPVLFCDGVGVYGDDPFSYAFKNCQVTFKRWEDSTPESLTLLGLLTETSDDWTPENLESQSRRVLIELLSATTDVANVLGKYGGKLENETYRGARYAFHINRTKMVLTISY